MQYQVALLASALALTAAPPAARAGITVFLERHGGTVTAGPDDAEAGSSSLVHSRGLRAVRVPAFAGGDAGWARVVDCVRDGFADFDIDVVDRRPAGGDYLMIMIGGRPGMLGYGDGVSGVAPWDGGIIARAVAYVFSDHLDSRADAVCQGVLHETGHALGLDHTYYCPDVMSYLHGCGEKSFTRVDAACGEYEERACAQGGSTQSSYRHLARVVGLREGGAEAGDGGSPQPDLSEEDATGADTEDETEAETEDDTGAETGDESFFVVVRSATAMVIYQVTFTADGRWAISEVRRVRFR